MFKISRLIELQLMLVQFRS